MKTVWLGQPGPEIIILPPKASDGKRISYVASDVGDQKLPLDSAGVADLVRRLNEIIRERKTDGARA